MAAMIPECDMPECGPDPSRGEGCLPRHTTASLWLSLAGTDTVMFVQLNDLKRESLFWGSILYT